MLKEIKTVKITEKGQVAIPKDIRKMEGFRKGSKIAILAFDNYIELRPLNKISKEIKEITLASEKSLAKDWNSKEEDEAWKDL